MSTINNDDLFLVERNNTSHSVTAENLMSTIQETDLMLIERGGVSYKVTGKDVGDQLGGPSGIIDAPVVVTSPKDKSGLTTGGKVTPAAEGITSVVETTTTQQVWSNYWESIDSGDQKPPVDAELTFDGDITTFAMGAYIDGVSYFGVWRILTPIICTKVELYVRKDRNYVYSNKKPFNINDQDASSALDQLPPPTGDTVEGWVDVSEFLTDDRFYMFTIARGDVSAYNGFRVNAVKVDGKILIDGDINTTASLTYTTDNNLSLLTAGQSMTQVPAYTPQTDLITKVETTSAWNQDQVWSDNASGEPMETPWSKAFDGVLTTASSAVAPSNDKTAILTFSNAIPFTTLRFHGRRGGSETKEGALAIRDDQGTKYTIPSSDIPVSDDGSNPAWFSSAYTISNIKTIEMTRGSNYGLTVDGIEVDGRLLADTGVGGAPQIPLLTFATDKDIVNFRPGDVVQATGTGNPAWNETRVWSDNCFSSNSNSLRTKSNMFDGDVTKYFQNIPADGNPAEATVGCTFNPPLNGQLRVYSQYNTSRKVTVTHSDGTKTNNAEFLASWASFGSLTGITKIECSADTGTGYGGFISAVEVDGKLLVDATSVVKVISTNKAASQITVDGGTWSNGNQLDAGPFTASGDYVSHDS